ncbi:3-dehydroquinate synthase [Halalkalibacterium ligniniphilum]|uniref:3-dehydroquinate synthase n=1 Tax=Halalkalibacterium ligniniphilum TaxID=1134413 RepID=UPI000349730D|nr:3-dehydroquinate synthase [Halalkalibacterium ligniniphilum]
MTTLPIQTSSKTYDVVIKEGVRKTIGHYLQEKKIKPSSVLIITDDVVAKRYLADVKEGLIGSYPVYEAIVPSGEATKSFKYFDELLTRALEKSLDRKSLIIALGGGVIGDLAGFVAATFMRGIPFIQVPTTLLAHDSSVGGKVAINHPLGKNMIGAFHQPEAVLYDPETLSSLPEKEWRSGFAEVMKHGFICDKSFLSWLQEQIDDLQSVKGAVAEEMLARSIGVKAAIVAEDEKETGLRALLNFGHTLGHAIEANLGYGEMTHGEAVVIGMLFAMRVSEDRLAVRLPIQETELWFRGLGYETTIPKQLSSERLVETMKKDKKAEAGTLRMVLLKEVGEAFVDSVDETRIYELLDKLRKEA